MNCSECKLVRKGQGYRLHHGPMTTYTCTRNEIQVEPRDSCGFWEPFSNWRAMRDIPVDSPTVEIACANGLTFEASINQGQWTVAGSTVVVEPVAWRPITDGASRAEREVSGE